jgi:hypothetical protein
VFARALSTALDAWVAQSAVPARSGPAVAIPPAVTAPTRAPVAATLATAAPTLPPPPPPPPAAAAWTPGGGMAPPAPAPVPAATPAAPAGNRTSMLVVGGILGVLLAGAGGAVVAMKSRTTSTADSTRGAPAAGAGTTAPNATASIPPAPNAPAPHVQTPNAPTSSAPASSAPASSAPTPNPVPAAPAPSGTRPVVRPPATPGGGTGDENAASGSASSAAVRRTLDSLAQALDPTSADESAARAALPVLRAIMPRLTSGDDSTWATVRLIEAHLLLNDPRQACVAVRQARALARTSAQREAIRRYDTGLSCGA